MKFKIKFHDFGSLFSCEFFHGQFPNVNLNSVPTDSGPRRDKPQTGDRVLGAQGSLMREGNEGYPVWSELTEGRP